MVEPSEHSAIVEGLRSGTNEGLAAFYDLYADKLYDFARRQLRDASLAADVVHDTVLIVRSRIGQLRDESKFRAWVYAIVRNEVRAKARARSRHVREEYAPEPSVDPDFAGDHDRRELASLIDEAVAGLTEREQEVFHLFARQGLSNDEIAASLELSFANAQKLVQRVRDRIARSAGALLVARQGRKDCSDLNILLVDWDGTFSPLWRKRIARHVDECSACERRRAVLLQPGGAVMAAPYYAAPASLRSRIFDSVAAGVQVDLSTIPKPPFVRRPAVLSTVAGVAFVALVGFVANNGGESPRLVTMTSSPAAESTDSTAGAAATVSSTVPPPTPSQTAAPAATVSSTAPPKPGTTVSPTTTAKKKPATSVPATLVPSTLVTESTASADAAATVDPATALPAVAPTASVSATTVAPTPTPASTPTVAPTTVAPVAVTTTTLSAPSVIKVESCKDLMSGGAGISLVLRVTDPDGVKAVVSGRYKSKLSGPTSVSGDLYSFYVLKGSSTVVEPFRLEVRATDTKGNVTSAFPEATSKNCA